MLGHLSRLFRQPRFKVRVNTHHWAWLIPMSSPVYLADIDAESAEAFWLTEPGIQKAVNILRREFPHARFTTARWQAKTAWKTTTFEVEPSEAANRETFLAAIEQLRREILLDAFQRLARPPGSTG